MGQRKIEGHIARRTFLGAIAGTAALPLTTAFADTWPERPIRFVVPFAAGGPADLLCRHLAEGLSEKWKQPVIVENRLGAGGSIGTASVSKSAPDGYTLLMQSLPHVTNAALLTLPYDPIKDFTAIAGVAYQPSILCVSPSFPVKTLNDFIDAARNKAEPVTLGTGGPGSISHLAGLELEQRADLKLSYVPFNGSAQTVTALLGGHIKSSFLVTTLAVPMIEGGKVSALCVTSKERWRELPNIPSITELGYPNSDCVAWYAVLGPAGMDEALTLRIYSDVQSLLKIPDVRRKLYEAGLELMDQRPDAIRATMQSDLDKWTSVMKKAGIEQQK